MSWRDTQTEGEFIFLHEPINPAMNLTVHELLQNQYFVTVLAVVVATYAGFAAPKPSVAATAVLTSDWFRFIVIFLIAYLPKRNFHLSLLIAIGFVVTYNVLIESKLFEDFMNGSGVPEEESH